MPKRAPCDARLRARTRIDQYLDPIESERPCLGRRRKWSGCCRPTARSSRRVRRLRGQSARRPPGRSLLASGSIQYRGRMRCVRLRQSFSKISDVKSEMDAGKLSQILRQGARSLNLCVGKIEPARGNCRESERACVAHCAPQPYPGSATGIENADAVRARFAQIAQARPQGRPEAPVGIAMQAFEGEQTPGVTVSISDEFLARLVIGSRDIPDRKRHICKRIDCAALHGYLRTRAQVVGHALVTCFTRESFVVGRALRMHFSMIRQKLPNLRRCARGPASGLPSFSKSSSI